jgi:hypothetical protein
MDTALKTVASIQYAFDDTGIKGVTIMAVVFVGVMGDFGTP